MPLRALKFSLKSMHFSRKTIIVAKFINHFSRKIEIHVNHWLNFISGPNNARIPIDFSQAPIFDSGLGSVFDLILRTVSADWTYLEEIFEAPRSVMDTLLKKVFEEIVIQNFL